MLNGNSIDSRLMHEWIECIDVWSNGFGCCFSILSDSGDGVLASEYRPQPSSCIACGIDECGRGLNQWKGNDRRRAVISGCRLLSRTYVLRAECAFISFVGLRVCGECLVQRDLQWNVCSLSMIPVWNQFPFQMMNRIHRTCQPSTVNVCVTHIVRDMTPSPTYSAQQQFHKNHSMAILSNRIKVYYVRSK